MCWIQLEGETMGRAAGICIPRSPLEPWQGWEFCQGSLAWNPHRLNSSSSAGFSMPDAGFTVLDAGAIAGWIGLAELRAAEQPERGTWDEKSSACSNGTAGSSSPGAHGSAGTQRRAEPSGAPFVLVFRNPSGKPVLPHRHPKEVAMDALGLLLPPCCTPRCLAAAFPVKPP